MSKVRGLSAEQVTQVCYFDAQHETDRKAQLEKLFARTQEQVSDSNRKLDAVTVHLCPVGRDPLIRPH